MRSTLLKTFISMPALCLILLSTDFKNTSIHLKEVDRQEQTHEDSLMFEHNRLLFLGQLKFCLSDQTGSLKGYCKMSLQALHHENPMEAYLEYFEGKSDIFKYSVIEKNPFKLRQARQSLQGDIERVKQMALVANTTSLTHPLHGAYSPVGDYDFENERFILRQTYFETKYFGGFPPTLPDRDIKTTSLYLKPDKAEAIYKYWNEAYTDKLHAVVHYSLVVKNGGVWVKPRILEFYKTKERKDLIGRSIQRD